MRRILSIPRSAAEFDVPDMPRWAADSATGHFSGTSQLTSTIQPADQPTMNLSLADLAFIINTRKSFPAYRPDIIIPSNLADRVAAIAAGNSLVMTPAQQPPISDDLAVSSLLGISKPPAIPLTFNPYSPLNMRPKVSFPSNPRAFGAYPQTIAAGPLMVRSMGMLSAFSAFSDDPVDAGLSPQEIADANTVASGSSSANLVLDGGYVSSASNDTMTPAEQAAQNAFDAQINAETGAGPAAAASVPVSSATGSNWGTSLINALPSLLTGTGNIITATSNSNAYVTLPNGQRVLRSSVPATSLPGAPINWTPILLIGGGILALTLLMRRRSS